MGETSRLILSRRKGGCGVGKYTVNGARMPHTGPVEHVHVVPREDKLVFLRRRLCDGDAAEHADVPYGLAESVRVDL